MGRLESKADQCSENRDQIIRSSISMSSSDGRVINIVLDYCKLEVGKIMKITKQMKLL